MTAHLLTAWARAVLGGPPDQQSSTFTGAIVASHTMPPPAGIVVAGADFEQGGAIAFDGRTPVVAHWNAVPGAQLYRFTLGKAGTTAMPFADISITTTETSVTVPATLIEPGTRYQLLAEAIQTPTDYASGQLVVTVRASVGVPSARFRFLPSCGNGVVDANEDCDTAGESATCNADCTFALCGDGVVNTSAGEACDTVQSSDTCTADCKSP